MYKLIQLHIFYTIIYPTKDISKHCSILLELLPQFPTPFRPVYLLSMVITITSNFIAVQYHEHRAEKTITLETHSRNIVWGANPTRKAFCGVVRARRTREMANVMYRTRAPLLKHIHTHIIHIQTFTNAMWWAIEVLHKLLGPKLNHSVRVSTKTHCQHAIADTHIHTYP